MAMGVSPASNVAQDVANMLLWKLLRMLDESSAPYVASLRAARPLFDRRRVWRRRLQLAHDDYGTQARLADALQFTDDAEMAAATPEVGVELMVLFAHMIGPPHMWAAARMGPHGGARNGASPFDCDCWSNFGTLGSSGHGDVRNGASPFHCIC